MFRKPAREYIQLAIANRLNPAVIKPTRPGDRFELPYVMRSGSEQNVIAVESRRRIDHVKARQRVRHMNETARLRRKYSAVEATGSRDGDPAFHSRSCTQCHAIPHPDSDCSIGSRGMLRTLPSPPAEDHLNA